MTHRDRPCGPSGRREAVGNAGHCQGFPTPSDGSHGRPERRLSKAFGQRRARLAMSRIATPRAPCRKPWKAVPMGHYHRSLVLFGAGRQAESSGIRPHGTGEVFLAGNPGRAKNPIYFSQGGYRAQPMPPFGQVVDNGSVHALFVIGQIRTPAVIETFGGQRHFQGFLFSAHKRTRRNAGKDARRHGPAG